MTSVRRSVVVAATLLTACSFGSPSPSPGGTDATTEPDAAVAIDAPDPPPQAWLQPWARRKAITLRAEQIEAPGNGALTDFPVLVSITDAELSAAALASGDDIVFTAGDATTMLASEIESFTPGDNQLVAWIKVPSLSALADTRLYVYYGHPTPPARTPENVWSSSYLSVWHLQQDPGPGGNGEIRDATSANRDGTASSQMDPDDSVPAKVGRGMRFNGTDEFLDFASMSYGDEFTISMWVQFPGGISVKPLLANSQLGGDTDGFRFFINLANTQDRRFVFETGNGVPGSVRRAITNMNAINPNTFTHVSVVANRTAETATLYVNGASNTADPSLRDDFRTSSDFEISRLENSGFYFTGLLDEVQISGTRRSPEWLLTAYNNQSQPGTFHTVSPEEQKP